MNHSLFLEEMRAGFISTGFVLEMFSIVDVKRSCFADIKMRLSKSYVGCLGTVCIIFILYRFFAQANDHHASCSWPSSVLT